MVKLVQTVGAQALQAPPKAPQLRLARPRKKAAKQARRKMPKQKPGSSVQDYGTPREFLDPCEERFGEIQWDLAAHSRNAVCDLWIGEDQNSLSVNWSKLGDGVLWLNPPYERIAPWAAKCALEAKRGARVLFLVPASVGSNWYWEHVAGQALVLCLTPRLMFDGHIGKQGKPEPYPKDLILAAFGFGAVGFERWAWKPQRRVVR